MKKSKALNLEPCSIEFYSDDEAALFDLLLTRVLGQKMFFAKRLKKPTKTYRFLFWATDTEQKILEEAWDKVLKEKWEELETIELNEKKED